MNVAEKPVEKPETQDKADKKTETSEKGKARGEKRDAMKHPQAGDILALTEGDPPHTKPIIVRLITDDHWVHYTDQDASTYIVHENMWESFTENAKVLWSAPEPENLTKNASLEQFEAAEIRERSRVMRAQHRDVSELGAYVSRDQGPSVKEPGVKVEGATTGTAADHTPTPGQVRAKELSDQEESGKGKMAEPKAEEEGGKGEPKKPKS